MRRLTSRIELRLVNEDYPMEDQPFLLVDRQGVLKIADFGTSCLCEGDANAGPEPLSRGWVFDPTAGSNVALGICVLLLGCSIMAAQLVLEAPKPRELPLRHLLPKIIYFYVRTMTVDVKFPLPEADYPSGKYLHLAKVIPGHELKNMTADDGYAYFVKKVGQIAIANGRRPVQWSEVYDHFKDSLDKKTIVHVWKAKDTLTEVVKAGYQALINNDPGDDSWYLDGLGHTWKDVYGNEPCVDIDDEEQCKLVLGGQGEMWGETVDTSDLEQTVWPKMAAIAERLWSARSVNNTDAALPRLERFRCLLNRRGVRAAPVTNADARSAPGGPRPRTAPSSAIRAAFKG